MRKSFYLLGIALIWLVACTGAPSNLSHQQTITATKPFTPGTSTALALPESTLSPTRPPTATSTATTPPRPTPVPTLAPITPEVVRVCPNNPEVPLGKFDLGDYYLVARRYDPHVGKVEPEVSGAVVVPMDRPLAQVIPNSKGRPGWELINYKPAADGQSVELTYQEKNGNRRQIWQSSWDGQQQKLVADFSLPSLPPQEGYQVYSYRQVDGNWYAVMKFNLKTGERFPVRLYNRTTGETREVPLSPKDATVRNFFSLDGVPYVDYQQGVDINKIFLYNLETFTAVPILKWLWNDEGATSLNTIWIVRDGFYYVQVARPYGVDLGIGLDLNTIKSNRNYHQVMQPVYLPGPKEDYVIIGDFLENPPGYLYYRPDFERGTSPVYFLDFSDSTIKDYCYSVENFSKLGLWSTHSISPEQRFVAYTHIETSVEGNPDKITKVEILDLVTGEFATIPDANFEVIGWGKK